MSIPTPKAYQSEAIEFLDSAISSLLKTPEANDRLIVLQAPTGSGKTLVVAYALAVANESHSNRKFVTLWLSPGKGDLHKQSARSLKSMLEGSVVKVQLLDSQDDIVANENPTGGTIFVVNWEKLRAQDKDGFSNRMQKEGEKTNFFDLLKNVSDAGLDLVVVIDESHTNLGGPQTIKLMDAIKAITSFIQLDTSATPTTAVNDELQAEGFHFKHTIPFSRVEAEGMVRRSVLLNNDFSEIQDRFPKENLEKQVLIAAWERVLDLRRRFNETGSSVKPLLLIQYPDGAGAESRARVVEQFLDSKGLIKDTTYATWLSGDHSDDLENISKHNSPYEVLIFKQAIATGWDCPRAQILVQFREPGSPTFRIQTLGRILRTPEQKHYEDEVLNVAYVYSDLAGVDVRVETDMEDFPVQDMPVKRGAKYPELGLKLSSVFQPRRREFHYPTSENLQHALFAQLTIALKGNIPEEPISKVPSTILTDAALSFKDIASGQQKSFGGIELSGFLGDEMVESLYNWLLVRKVGNYKSKTQTRTRIKSAIVRWFGSERPQWLQEDIQRFIVSQAEIICEAINAACLIAQVSDEQQAIADARAKRRVNSAWEIKVSDLIASKNYEVGTLHGCLLEPAVTAKARSNPERRFEEWASKATTEGHISWWWKNGERDEKFLGVPYKLLSAIDEPEEIAYPDYILMTSQNELFVLEVKDVNDRDGKVNGKSHSIAGGLLEWAVGLNKARQEKSGLYSLPKITAGVVVPIDLVNAGVLIKISDPLNWHEPTTNNLSINMGWNNLSFQSHERV